MSGRQSPEGRTLGRRDGLGIAAATVVSAGTGYVVLAAAARLLVPVSLNTQFVTFWSTLFAGFGVLSGLSIETTRAVAASSLAGSVPDGKRPQGPYALAVGGGFGLVLAAIVAATSPWWAARPFPEHTAWLAALLSVAVAAYSAHSVVVGALAGRRRWGPYARLITADATARFVLVLAALATLATVTSAAAAAVLAAFTWAGFLAFSRAGRSAARARVDSATGTFVRRILAAAVATGSSALLVVGFPALLSATTSRAAFADAAPLLLAIALTRAPLLIPLTAYQGVAVSHFVTHRERGLGALVPIARVVVLVGAGGAVAAWLIGPWLMQTVLGEGYRVAGNVLAALTLAAAGLAVLTLTGALCQALTRHTAFVTGWVAAVVGALAILLLPFDLTSRAILALLVGPLLGVAVHLVALRGSERPAPEAEVERPPTAPRRDRPTVTVCLATYNGAAHVAEQLVSVLEQLAPHDEVVVVDDASTDDTVDRVLALDDPRVRIHRLDANVGYVRAFEQAMRLAEGDLLLLCDQDDVWRPGRVTAMVDALTRTRVVATNLGTLDGPPRLRGPYGQADWRLREAQSAQHARNVLGILAGNRPYYGCAMGLRRDALDVVLPFPGLLVESHDLWIALYGNLSRSITHLEMRSLDRRFHTGNASSPTPRGVVAVLRSRAMLARAVVELRRRLA